MDTQQLVLSDSEYLVEERDELLVIAHEYSSIATQEDYERAAAFVRVRCKGVIDEIKEKCKKAIDAARKSLDEALDLERFLLGSLPAAMKIVEKGMASYLLAEDEKRRAMEVDLSKRLGQTVVLPAPNAKGVHGRSTWRATIEEEGGFEKLVRFVAKNPDYLNLLKPNLPDLNKLASALRDKLDIPGVKAEKNISIVKK